MNTALQLGFKSFINLSRFVSFAVSARTSRVVTVVPLRVGMMAPKRLSSSVSISASSVADEKKGKKVKGLVGANPDSQSRGVVWRSELVDDDDTNQKAKGLMGREEDVTEDLKGDTVNIDKMTVQELRTALRNAGLPVKGCKRDLVSALKCYLDKKLDGESLETEQLASLSVDSLSVIRKSKQSDEECSVDMTAVSEAPKFQRSKRRMKQSDAAVNIETVDSEIIRKRKTIRNYGTSGRMQSSRKSLIPSGIDREAADSGVDILTNENEPWTIFAHKKPQKGWIVYNPKTMRPHPLTVDMKSVKLMSWNVNGLRALLKLEGFSALQLAERENFDVLCLQETKLQEKDIQSIEDSLLDGYPNCYWTCSVSKLGYSGTAIISRIKPLSVRYGLGIADHDGEGRIVTAEFDSFYLISAYVPNSGDGLRRLTYRVTEWDTSLSNYMKELEKAKPVILTGDLNCAHEEIDIYNPAGNRRSAGFTNEERQSFETNFLSRGFVDTFRKQHPGVVGYTYWGYRHGARKTNKGWRLDYFLVSESLADKVHDSYILPDVTGSDHSPIGLVLKL